MTTEYQDATPVARSDSQLRRLLPFDEDEIAGSVAARFERVVSLCPDAAALETDACRWTYAELNRRANRIARALTTLGEAPSEPIALLLAHDTPLIIGMLGVLKAGKFFCVLDPSDPPARIRFLLDDLQARWLVTTEQYAALAAAVVPPSCRVLPFADLDADCTENLTLPPAPDALATILYTSGSTGQAKGVIRTHLATLQRARVDHATQNIHVGDRVAWLTLPSTGIGYIAPMQALLNGATLLPFSLRAHGVTALVEWLVRQRVTHFRMPASTLRHFVLALDTDQRFPDLRWLETTGDVLYGRDVELLRQHTHPDMAIIYTDPKLKPADFSRASM